MGLTNLDLPVVSRINWRQTYRIIPSRYPPVDLFERVADPGDWDQLANLEALTNPRLRDQWGQINMVPPERRVAGPGATYVMAPFTHLRREGSRFSDGTFGVYYAANCQDAAIRETMHHMAKFYGATQDPAHREDMRVLIGAIDSDLHDIRGEPQWEPQHHPDDYAASRALGCLLRSSGSNGIAYKSVRHAGSENIAAFWPNVVSIPIQGAHLQYDWDGNRIPRYFDYSADAWIPV